MEEELYFNFIFKKCLMKKMLKKEIKETEQKSKIKVIKKRSVVSVGAAS